MGIEYQQGIVYGDRSTVFWWADVGVLPCYILPYRGTNVPIGIGSSFSPRRRSPR